MIEAILIGIFVSIIMYFLFQIITTYTEAKEDKTKYALASEEEKKEMER